VAADTKAADESFIVKDDGERDEEDLSDIDENEFA
jgi:hypothetical protein